MISGVGCGCGLTWSECAALLITKAGPSNASRVAGESAWSKGQIEDVGSKLMIKWLTANVSALKHIGVHCLLRL